ncbi:hypothetical protein, partial [Klebsiella pneumoniae]|uniref:hypothetical protein n=1 Tax=Klebsiella pneumoniae TaxID=573 RepID=UPI003A7FC376
QPRQPLEAQARRDEREFRAFDERVVLQPGQQAARQRSRLERAAVGVPVRHGGQHPGFERVDGQAAPGPHPREQPQPAGVGDGQWSFAGATSTPSGQVWLVGSATPPDGLSTRSFVDHLDAAGWSLTQLPDSTVAGPYDTMSEIAAGGDTDVWAVGSAGSGNAG